jgi:gliding motility-associated lipoprotein GldH
MKKAILLALISIFLLGCQKGILFTEFKHLPVSGWEADSVFCFELSLQDSQPICDVEILVRHTDQYEYQNLWLFVEMKRDSITLSRDTIGCYLASDRGEWYGTGMRVYEMPISYLESYAFPSEGISKIYVSHGMRSTILRGVIDLGVKVLEKK